MVNLHLGTKNIRNAGGRYSGLLTPDELAPTTGQVAEAYIDDAWLGDLTANQLFEAGFLGEYDKLGDPLDKDSYKKSEFYREGIEYYEGMSTASAEFLAKRRDEENARMDVMSRASGWQTAGGITSALGAGVFEPLNLGVGLVTAGLGTLAISAKRLGTTMKNLSKYGKYTPNIVRGATEGLVAAGVIEAISAPAQEVVQSDYDTADSLMNIGTSLLFGVGFDVGGQFISNKISSKRIVKEQNRLDGAVQQIFEGKSVDINAVDNVTDVEGFRGGARALQNELDEIEINALRKIDELLSQKEVLDENVFSLLKEKQEVISSLRSEKSPKSLLSFLIKEGGLKDYKGELKALGLDAKSRPGLLSNKGLDLDEAGLRAFEAGYFNERPDVPELLQAIDDDFSFKNKVPQSELGKIEYINALQQQLEEVDRLLSSYGVEDDVAEFRRMSQKLQMNKNIDDAIIRLEQETQKKVEDIKSKISEHGDVRSDNIYDDADFIKDERFFNNADEVDVSGRVEEIDQAIKDLDEIGLLTDEEKLILDSYNKVNEEDIIAAYRAAEICLTRG